MSIVRKPIVAALALGLLASCGETSQPPRPVAADLQAGGAPAYGGTYYTTPATSGGPLRNTLGESALPAPPAPARPVPPPAPPPQPGNARAGHDFALGSCVPCHVVAADQNAPLRFANAPDFRAIAAMPNATPFQLNVWLTNPHPTMPTLVLSPQEAADVIAYIESLKRR